VMVQVSVIVIVMVRRIMGCMGLAYTRCAANRSEKLRKNYADLRKIWFCTFRLIVFNRVGARHGVPLRDSIIIRGA